MDQLHTHWTKERLTDIQAEGIRSYFQVFSNLYKDWEKHDGETNIKTYSTADPIVEWAYFLRQSEQASGVIEQFQAERQANTSKSTLYNPVTFLGPVEAKTADGQLAMTPYEYSTKSGWEFTNINEIPIINNYHPPPRPSYTRSEGSGNPYQSIPFKWTAFPCASYLRYHPN